MFKLFGKNTVSYVISLLLALGLLTACTATKAAQEPPTPTPEVFIPRTAVAPQGPTIAGRVVWGETPVAGARVELRIGAWADPTASETIAQTIADANGYYELEAPPNGGEFGLVALWPDGSANTAPVTPVQVSDGVELAGIDVYLAKELELLEPLFGAEVDVTPTLSWTGLPGVAAYQLWIMDAGTTELVFDLVITETSQIMQIVAPPLTPGRTYRWEVNGWETNNADSSASNLLASLTSEFKVKTPDASALPTSPCATTFEHRELREPYQRQDDQARYTLSAEELNTYLATMGILELCIPPEFGAPFINFDTYADACRAVVPAIGSGRCARRSAGLPGREL